MAWQGTESSSFWQKSCCSLSSVQRWGRLCSAHTRTNAGFAAFWGGRRTGNAPAPARTRIPNLNLAIEIQGTRVAPRAEREKKEILVRAAERRSALCNRDHGKGTHGKRQRHALMPSAPLWSGMETNLGPWCVACCSLARARCSAPRTRKAETANVPDCAASSCSFIVPQRTCSCFR
jgi:hypothetical protein